MTSPTERTLKLLRSCGYEAEVVEKWVQFGRGKGGVRKDFLGGIDILAINEKVTLAVQCTSGSNLSERVKKLIALPKMKRWLAGPNRKLEVWGWRRCSPRGKKRPMFKLRRVRIVLMNGCFVTEKNQ